MDAAAIASRACPVLFLDTCSLLDIMRDPTRDTARPADRLVAFELVAAMEANRLTCILAQQVKVEFSEHDQRTQDEAEQKLQKLRDQVHRVNALAELYGAVGTVDLTHLSDHVTRARALVQRYLAQAIEALPSAEAPGRAFARVNKGIAPARKGKDSSKDCLVYETCMEAAIALRENGLATPIVFLSSNTTDYRDGQALRPEVNLDFQPLNIQYAANIGHAKFLLGL